MVRKDQYQIPFTLFGKAGTLEACYGINMGPVESGFEIVGELVPNLDMCIGYPTMHAYIKDYRGFGLAKYCGWIQAVRIRLYENSHDIEPSDAIDMVDVPPIMREMGIPFCAYGYPAEVYDAPVNNFSNGKRLIWTANTYFVSMPSYINNNKIEFLAQFKWGYIDDPNDGDGLVKVLPFEIADKEHWRDDLKLLSEHFPNWDFAR